MWGRGWGVCAAAPGSENYLCRRTEWTCGLDTWSHPSFRPPEDGAAIVWQHKDLNMTISRSRIVLQHHMIMLWYITVKPFLINEQNLLVPDWGIYKILNWSYKHWRNVHSPSHMGSGGGLAPQCELPCSSTASAAAHESSYQESRVYWDSAGSTSETKSQGLSLKVFSSSSVTKMFHHWSWGTLRGKKFPPHWRFCSCWLCCCLFEVYWSHPALGSKYRLPINQKWSVS